jgi:hypothetical protein
MDVLDYFLKRRSTEASWTASASASLRSSIMNDPTHWPFGLEAEAVLALLRG